jgi:hypothetical protein
VAVAHDPHPCFAVSAAITWVAIWLYLNRPLCAGEAASLAEILGIADACARIVRRGSAVIHLQ